MVKSGKAAKERSDGIPTRKETHVIELCTKDKGHEDGLWFDGFGWIFPVVIVISFIIGCLFYHVGMWDTQYNARNAGVAQYDTTTGNFEFTTPRTQTMCYIYKDEGKKGYVLSNEGVCDPSTMTGSQVIQYFDTTSGIYVQ